MIKLNVKTKLKLALLIPIIGLVYFMLQISISDLKEREKIFELKHFLHISISISNVVHELQKERGFSAGYIGSNGLKFKSELIEQRKITDEKIKHLKKDIINDSTITYPSVSFKNLEKTRKDIDNLNIKFEDIIKYYSNINKYFINFIATYSLNSHNSKITKMILSYVYLLRSKENSGIERAILSNVFASGKMNYDIYREFSILYASSLNYIEGYKSLATKKQLQEFNKKLINNPEIKDVEKLRKIAFSKVIKDKIISDIKEIIGYGGMIHDFKNYVLRGDKSYEIKFNKNYQKFVALCDKYSSLKTTTKKELELIKIIKDTFLGYKNGLKKVVKAHKQNIKIKELDKIVKIDDKPAIDAIYILSNNVLGANATHWFEVATKRINILKNLESSFIKDMIMTIDNIDTNLYNKLVSNSIIFIIIIFVLFILSIKLIYDVTDSIKKFKYGLNNFFEYLTTDSKDIKMIDINTNDEFGQMAKMINNNMTKTKSYLDAKVEQQLIENKKKEEILFQQSKLASMGEMIGNIAHQWRQPLSVIATSATGIKLQKELGMLEDQLFYKACDAINENAQYLSKTIDDFKNFIKGDRKKRVFKLNNTINSFMHLIDASVKNAQIDIILNIHNDIKINGYENELIQCIINIFNNSKDILENQDDERLVFISATQKEHDVIIELKDNAGGIPQDVLPKIFEPYFTTKHQSQGTGLGLHMTYNLIVDGMDGDIIATNCEYTYNSKNYKGASFKIILPQEAK